MPDSVDERLLDLRARLRIRDKLAKKVEDALGQLERQKANRGRLRDALAKEEKDVKKLEGLSLGALFAWISGNKEEKLETERREFAEAAVRYDECRGAIHLMEEQMGELDAQLREHSGLDEEWTRALVDKEAFLTSQGGPRARAILENAEEIGNMQADLKELEEAVAAGIEAERALDKVSSELNSAEDLGTWDMLGGGMIVTSMKRSAMSKASVASHQAQQKLRVFRHELGDVGEHLTVDLKLGQFLGIADYFFDSFFVDLAVQNKIHSAQSKTRDALAAIGRLTRQLKIEVDRVRQELADLREARALLIERA